MMIREYRESDWQEIEALYGKMLTELYAGDVARYPEPLLAGLFYPLRPEHITIGIVIAEKTGPIKGFIVGHRHSESIFRISNAFIAPDARGTIESVVMYQKFRDAVKDEGYKYLIAGVSSRQKDINDLLEGLGFADFETYKFKELS